MNNEFYEQQKYNSSEYAIAMEDFYYTSMGKFYIPALFPFIQSSSPMSSNVSLSPSKIEDTGNNDRARLAISSVSTTNYIELRVPIYMTSQITDEYGYIHKGTKFIITFVGGDVSCPHIIGVC